jgi:phosphoenolpyruvate phosphomutase
MICAQKTMEACHRQKAFALRQLLFQARPVRAVGAIDALSAMLANRAGFEAVWAGGLGISAGNGVPDCGLLTMTELLDAAERMDLATSLPVIADCDTGFGDANALTRAVRMYERRGIAAMCIEDKQLPKRNSFRDGHRLADQDEFAAKVEAAKAAQLGPDFVLIARLESLVAGGTQREAIVRGESYVEAGADAVLIHSKSSGAEEVMQFASEWRRRGNRTPLAAVPTTYVDVTASELAMGGIDLVIYANQPLRAAIAAMSSTMDAILATGASRAVEDRLVSVHDVLELIGTGQAEQRESDYAISVRARRARRGSHAPDEGHATPTALASIET